MEFRPQSLQEKKAKEKRHRGPRGTKLFKALGALMLGVVLMGLMTVSTDAAEGKKTSDGGSEGNSNRDSEQTVNATLMSLEAAVLPEITATNNSEFLATLTDLAFDLDTNLYPGTNEYQVGYSDPFPTNNAAMQVEWWQNVDAIYGLTHLYPVAELAENSQDFLVKVRTGDLIYFQRAHSTIGINQFSQGYMVVRGEDGVSLLSAQGESYSFQTWDEVLSYLYGSGHDQSFAPTYEGTATPESLALLHVPTQEVMRQVTAERWEVDPNLQLPELADQESNGAFQETEPAPQDLQVIGFYGGLRGWGGLSHNQAGNEIMGSAEFVDTFWQRYDRAQTILGEMAESATPAMDYIVLSADGTYSPYTTGVMLELLAQQEQSDRPLPRLTFNFRVPADWATNDVMIHLQSFVAGEHGLVDPAVMQRYLNSGGQIGFSLDFEVWALENSQAMPATSINNMYKQVLMLMRNQFFVGQSFQSSQVPFLVYDMGDGAIVNQAEQVMRGVEIVDMSISRTAETKLETLDRLSRSRGDGLNSMMLFDDEFAAYLEVQRQMSNQDPLFYDEFLGGADDLQDFVSQAPQSRLYFQ
jgi:hypothetical protein